MTGFSKADADQLRPICRFVYQPESSPVNRSEQIQVHSYPEKDSSIEPGLTLQKAELIVFNIRNGWIAYAINLKKTDPVPFDDMSDDRSIPIRNPGKPVLERPLSSTPAPAGPEPEAVNLITSPIRPDRSDGICYPIITKMRFCTPEELIDMKIDCKETPVAKPGR